MKIITIIIISILFTVQLIAQEGCMDEGACNYKPDASEEDGSCDYDKYNDDYCQSNLNVLQDFIDNSSNSVGGDSTDHTLSLENDENGDGIIQPLELARQGYNSDWVNGRLELWNCENCGLLGEIPVDINKLKYLRYLNISNNNLNGLFKNIRFRILC